MKFLHVIITIFFAIFMGIVAMAAETPQEIAERQFAAEEWKAAVQSYDVLTKSEPNNALYWFRLGSAHDSLDNYKAAKSAYKKALKSGHQPPMQMHYRLARMYMFLGNKASALKSLETVAELGGLNFRVVDNTEAFAALKDEPRFLAVLEALKPCQTTGYRDFDFWLGQWDVTTAGTSTPSATNKITNTYDGCVILEEYTAGFFTGTSLSFYDNVQDKWHQTWMSNGGGALYLEGGLNDQGAMVLSDARLPISAQNEYINRVTWTPQKDGSVRQHWQRSTDQGETWSDIFDGTYTVKPSEKD